MSKQRVIFCDFDGTITVNDNIVAIMKHFQPPGWDTIVEDVLAKRVSVREGVGRMFALLPTERRQEITDYAIGNVTIREGFRELLEYCRREGITFLVTSGGIDFFVYPVLSPFPIPEENIYCNGSDFNGSHIEILWPHACDEHCHNDCGMCKTAIIRSYPSDTHERILIGDSITDFEGAKLADLVFARAHLVDLCRELGLNYKPFETFHEVIRGLEELKVR
ncbi:2-hydroxy-3-keto-5-methylthiopentenyl-1-phosphate phosphatase [Paenibacillus mucilaginosus]|uniref:2-hydroxy-3-keto-5-methylthiopentenyl-1-phosphate phosphatase n=2 Tax=Paenibacillus mucilaginosus TaxID=61624 RepID=I0BQ22_9BACL|nr:2-hydroxy-3-keto-5-methylthiopentenyl-1-phosphate phosphatase [Paenibacillus mucilaginosus]AEI42560.1 MtnX [Paenibacillus mucilaginosus KNP414]AFH64469.1 2-hydroxy-3-keto-5-methylthiopentenyl-1-phosphate phosphatase [Paenibacillus mucilaginosus K02]MCG7213951.1 2-hydroxy-3-keto-5-methylthiopentenyl-1-phosphate phosphatase [Paenibacillus mucilaginosus]WDM25953.1 2-hydroxy-3-keto-5-methylthiopentenyl-1-phosphate phosphatase [Paenibacillus mucilaginosus]WFA20604.1 2-hydroxy-3-keto-5-methylthio